MANEGARRKTGMNDTFKQLNRDEQVIKMSNQGLGNTIRISADHRQYSDKTSKK